MNCLQLYNINLLLFQNIKSQTINFAVCRISSSTWAQEMLFLGWYCTSWQYFHHYCNSIYTCLTLISNTLLGVMTLFSLFQSWNICFGFLKPCFCQTTECSDLWEPWRELVVCWYTHWFSFQETAQELKPTERVSNYERKATLKSAGLTLEVK